jgi:uncharacterized membrane protein (UPF0127 family)
MKVRITNRDVVLAIADIADSPESRRRGLLGRAPLQPGEGLWISQCDSIHTYGMQFPIDVLFLGPDSQVLDIAPNMAAGGTVTRDGAASCLELPSGACEATGTQVGDFLELATLDRTMAAATIPGCIGLLNLAETYGLVQPGTTAAVSQLHEHARKIRAGFQGVRG